jgi:hypothetical protein
MTEEEAQYILNNVSEAREVMSISDALGDKEWFTFYAVAKAAACLPQLVRSEMLRGKIPYIDLPEGRRIARADAIDWAVQYRHIQRVKEHGVVVTRIS